jgi:hypothetical protein
VSARHTQRYYYRAIGRPATVVAGGAATIRLSSNEIEEDASIGALIGTLSVVNGAGAYTFSITADPDSKFAIDGDDLELAATVDWETATSHSVTVQATDGIRTVTTAFTINVLGLVQWSDDTTVQWSDDTNMHWSA